MLNLPVQTKNNVQVMSSIDLAKLCVGDSKDAHSDFIKKAKKVLSKDVGNFSDISKDAYGRDRKILLLPEREACLMAMSYSYELQAYVFDAWQKLKNKAPQIPQTYAEALQLAADQARQLELAAPKVAFVENLVKRSGLMNATQVAQKHGMSAVKLNKFLVEIGVYNQAVKRGKVFMCWFVEKGFGEMKQTEQGFSQALFTNAGEVWINEKLISEGVV